ncbi:MAG: hypothetical protein BIFFINMI_01647 [Phycisphaerae bacterium]|nr:hypothetical protein [Phycisphaerae bacterium]
MAKNRSKAKVARKAPRKPKAAPARKASAADVKKALAALHEVARACTVMFDGELCRQIVTERSWKWMRDFDPADVWSAHDNYDVEHGPFIAAKKTLLRLQNLAPAGMVVRCSLWQPVPTLKDRVTCVIQNGGIARWQDFGTLHMGLTPQQRRVLKSGKPVQVPPGKSGILTVLTPVRDSLKEITGFVEVSTSQKDLVINW